MSASDPASPKESPASQTNDLGVVISSGGWHTPPLYKYLVQALGQRGVVAEAPLMPTTNITSADVTDEENPIFNMAEPPEGWPTVNDDAKAIGSAALSLIDRGKKVLIIGHSMGGFAATQAALPEYQIQNRRNSGLPGGIIGLFYFGAYLLPVGIAVNEMVGEDVVPPYALLHAHGKRGLSTPTRMREYFFARVSEAEADWCALQMRAQPIPRERLTTDPYSILPIGYALCEEDMALPPPIQEQMCVATINGGANLKIFREPWDHSPELSATQKLADIITEFGQSNMGA